MRTKKSIGTKALVLLLTVVLLIGCAVGGTLAWLLQKTDPVVNTFTAGNINIALTESDSDPSTPDVIDRNYKMVPGNTITKDPKVQVVAGSEACWLFVKVQPNPSVAAYLEYSVDPAWTKLGGVDYVYYIMVSSDLAMVGQEYPVLTDNQVRVKENVTKEMMDAIQDDTVDEPTLSITAYAVQKDNFESADLAWAELNK